MGGSIAAFHKGRGVDGVGESVGEGIIGLDITASMQI